MDLSVSASVLGFAPSDFTGMTLQEATERGLQKLGPGSIACLVCGKESPSYTNAKNHFEAMHFASSGYNCEFCPKFMKTKHALDCHISRNHRNEKQAKFNEILFSKSVQQSENLPTKNFMLFCETIFWKIIKFYKLLNI